MRQETIEKVEFAVTIGYGQSANLWQLAKVVGYPNNSVLKNGVYQGFVTQKHQTICGDVFALKPQGRELSEIEAFLVRVASAEGQDVAFRKMRHEIDSKRGTKASGIAAFPLRNSQGFQDSVKDLI